MSCQLLEPVSHLMSLPSIFQRYLKHDMVCYEENERLISKEIDTEEKNNKTK